MASATVAAKVQASTPRWTLILTRLTEGLAFSWQKATAIAWEVSSREQVEVILQFRATAAESDWQHHLRRYDLTPAFVPGRVERQGQNYKLTSTWQAFFWAALPSLTFAWGYFRTFETRNRTFGEMDVMFQNGVPARKSAKYVVDAEEVYSQADWARGNWHRAKSTGNVTTTSIDKTFKPQDYHHTANQIYSTTSAQPKPTMPELQGKRPHDPYIVPAVVVVEMGPHQQPVAHAPELPADPPVTALMELPNNSQQSTMVFELPSYSPQHRGDDVTVESLVVRQTKIRERRQRLLELEQLEREEEEIQRRLAGTKTGV
ncbi:hypothetical protein B0H63DRAFT_447280 [Podospora didyma]|uniref:Uncharacterized protein n=1 Tax=Podospora didyma TaxID=330526 RepID=A0AAE0U5I9_9PEZI|nr:hypothetical protein B0H63DRAFT_447280 [Podospora didyma]